MLVEHLKQFWRLQSDMAIQMEIIKHLTNRDHAQEWFDFLDELKGERRAAGTWNLSGQRSDKIA